MQGIDDSVNEALATLDNIREQKENIINDFAAKYAVIDADVKDLETKKADLERQILILNNKKDSFPGMIESAIKKAEGIISAAKSEAEEVKEHGTTKANEIIEAANARESEVKALAESLNDLESRTNAALAEADSHLAYAKEARMKAENVLSDASKQAEVALKASAEAERLISLANVKKQAVELAEQALDVVRRAVEEQQIEIVATKGLLNDQKVAFEKEKDDFFTGLKAKVDQIEAKEAEISTVREQLIKQKDNNSLKSAELDAGFSKLKREQDDLKKQKAVLDNMAKEFSKKGE